MPFKRQTWTGKEHVGNFLPQDPTNQKQQFANPYQTAQTFLLGLLGGLERDGGDGERDELGHPLVDIGLVQLIHEHNNDGQFGQDLQRRGCLRENGLTRGE